MALTKDEMLAKARKHYEKAISQQTDTVATEHQKLNALQQERDNALAAIERYYGAQQKKAQADSDIVNEQSEMDRINNLP